MTKSRSSAVALCLFLTGCATSSGAPVARIAEPNIAAAYLPLNTRIDLGVDRAAGAAVVIAPGIAATNAHNADLIDAKNVIGTASLSDLMFFRVGHGTPSQTADPVVGEAVTAYGQGIDGSLRIAHGIVRQRVAVPGHPPAWFTFAGDAGPGFSGGPVIDSQGRLVGITFAYDDRGAEKLILAYDMTRVMAELSAFAKQPK